MHPVTSLRYSATDNVAAWKALPQLEGVNLDRRREARRDRARDASAAQDQERQADAGDRRRRVRQGPLARVHDRHAVEVGLRRGGAPRRRRPPLHEALGERDALADPGSRPAQPPRRQRRRRVRARRAGARDRAPARPRLPAAAERRGLARRQAWRGPGDRRAGRRRPSVTVGEDGTATYELGGLAPGVYRVEGKRRRSRAARSMRATSSSSARAAPSSTARSATATRSRRSPSATGGSALGADRRAARATSTFDPPRIVRVDRRTDVELWSRPGLLILIVGLLGLEWLLRQRSGYL